MGSTTAGSGVTTGASVVATGSGVAVVTTGSGVGSGAAVVAGADVVTDVAGAGWLSAFAIAKPPKAIATAASAEKPPKTADFVSMR
jgi:hypothetical protein